MDFSVKTFSVKDKEVGLRFGTRFFRLMQSHVKKNLSDLLNMIASGTYEFEFLCSAFECAAQDYAITNGKPIDFNNDDMSDWIDAVGGAEGAVVALTEGIAQYFPKNLKSLEETGEQVIQ